jgi:hypothetical protein
MLMKRKVKRYRVEYMLGSPTRYKDVPTRKDWADDESNPFVAFRRYADEQVSTMLQSRFFDAPSGSGSRYNLRIYPSGRCQAVSPSKGGPFSDLTTMGNEDINGKDVPTRKDWADDESNPFVAFLC